jgi:hypothetical protein
VALTAARDHGTPPRHKRPAHHHWVIGFLASLAALVLVVSAVWLLTDQRGSEAADNATPSGSRASSGAPSSTATAEIELDAVVTHTSRMEAVPLTGRLDAAPGTVLRVQLREGPERWIDFPLPTVVDEAGRFRTYVELGRRGTNRVRVVEPRSGVTSAVAVIEVR